MRKKNLIHPGEILQEEFLTPMGISQTRLALDIHVPAPRVNAIVRGRRRSRRTRHFVSGGISEWSRSSG